MAKKEALACRPCGYMVLVSDQGDAVIECYECGTEMVPRAAKKPAAKKALKAAAKKVAAKKPAAKKAAPKKKQ
jgi:DNA-directed RNA polymerase subunit M/transcription elongation factor TFIIS